MVQTIPDDRQPACLAQLQHQDASQKTFTMEHIEAIAEVHGVVCISDYSSIANFPYGGNAIMIQDISRALQPSQQFKASPATKCLMLAANLFVLLLNLFVGLCALEFACIRHTIT